MSLPSSPPAGRKKFQPVAMPGMVGSAVICTAALQPRSTVVINMAGVEASAQSSTRIPDTDSAAVAARRIRGPDRRLSRPIETVRSRQGLPVLSDSQAAKDAMIRSTISSGKAGQAVLRPPPSPLPEYRFHFSTVSTRPSAYRFLPPGAARHPFPVFIIPAYYTLPRLFTQPPVEWAGSF